MTMSSLRCSGQTAIAGTLLAVIYKAHSNHVHAPERPGHLCHSHDAAAGFAIQRANTGEGVAVTGKHRVADKDVPIRYVVAAVQCSEILGLRCLRVVVTGQQHGNLYRPSTEQHWITLRVVRVRVENPRFDDRIQVVRPSVVAIVTHRLNDQLK